MTPISDLNTHLELLSQRVGRANAVTVQHPAEIRAFQGLTPSELRAAAARHNLRVVSRMDGRQFEFTRFAKA